MLRASVFHTSRHRFREEDALDSFADDGLFIRDGRIAGCGDYAGLRAANPDAIVHDLRGGYLLQA